MSPRLKQANRVGAPRTMICAHLMLGLVCLMLATSVRAHKQQTTQNRHQVSRTNQHNIDRQEHETTEDDQRLAWAAAAHHQQHASFPHPTHHHQSNHSNKKPDKKKASNEKAEKRAGGNSGKGRQQQQLGARGEKPNGAGEQHRSELETLLALAANAARVGAIVSTADHQQQQQQRGKVAGKNAASNQASGELDSSDLIKSMQMINAGMPLAPPPPPPQPPARQQSNKPASGPKPPVASERIMNEGGGASGEADSSSGFDVVEAQNFAGGPQQTHQSFPEIITQQQHHHHHQTPHELEHEHRHEVGVDHAPLPRRPHEHVESVHHARPPLLNDFQVVNSLPSALDDHQPHHYGGQVGAHEHGGYAPSHAYHPSSSDVTPALKHPGIRVVFNNNPQFIIGANARDTADSYAAAASSPLQRKTRQPSASLYDNDQYHQDESAPDETKVSVLPCAEKTNAQRPITQQQQEELPKNIEKINIQEPVEPPVIQQQQVVVPKTEPPTKSTPFEVQQQQQEQHVEEPPPPPPVQAKSPPPVVEPPIVKTAPAKSRPPPIIEQQQQHVEPDEQVVDTPIEQVIKSGLRPPLRMVISMRNKHGDVMKVPVNLHGSTKLPPTKQAPTFELEPQMQIHFEKQPPVAVTRPPIVFTQQQQDENTPIGGDIFDPSLTRPFATKGKTTVGVKSPPVTVRPPVIRTPEVKIPPQVQEPQQQVVEEPPVVPPPSPPPVVKTKQVVVKEPPPLPEPEAQVKEAIPPFPPPQVKAPLPPPTPSPPEVIKTQHVATKRPDCHQQQQQQVIEPIEPQQQVPVKEPQVANPLPPPPVVKQAPTSPPVVQQQVQQTEEPVIEQQQQQAVVGPSISLGPSGDGLVHMMVPKLTQFQNKTFANMFSQFQQALSEHMTNHLASEAADKAASEERTRRREDEQEDLMVALMAANMNGGGGGDARGLRGSPMESRQPLSMTVIKPPRGMSLQEALRSHAREGQTMAILSSSGGAARALQPGSDEATPVGFDVMLRPAPTGNSRPNIGGPPAARAPADRQQPPVGGGGGNDQSEGGIDPDGFSAASSSANSFDRPNSSASSISRSRSFHDTALLDWLRHHEYNTRHKRDLAGDLSPRHLEADDKLPKPPTSSSRSPGGPAAKANATTSGRPGANKLRKKSGLASVRKQTPSQQQPRKQPPKRAPPSPSKSAPKRQRADKPGPKPVADFMASASHQNEVSSGDSSDDLEDAAADQGGQDDAEEDEPSSYSSSSSDEPAASASGEGGSESSGSSPGGGGGDDGDYTGDMGDDFDDSAGSFGDGDDEPYNQAAASDRDYSGASSTFEIPSIDINPDTLQQKGCRTVLREVHEIPMNGLGAVRADGQPGSGFGSGGGGDDHQASATTHSLGGLRVRRQATPAANSNLLNSRKVTSVVMTKECHFPNDSQEQTAKRETPPAALAPITRQQVEPVAFGGQGGASRARPTVVMPQQQQQPHAAPTYPAYQVLEGAGRKSLPAFRTPNSNEQQQRLAQQQQQQQAQRMISANFYANSQRVAPQRPLAAGQLVQYYTAPQQMQRQQQPLASASSTIKRRSVAPLVPQPQQPARQASAAPPAPIRGPAPQDDIYVGAASGVVAKKLYKPPSEDDPYHTLSYSSQTGADPDMEDDEDDSAVMGGDGGPSASDGADERASPSSQKRSRETLSDRERAALMDPNHDDTDPEVRATGSRRERRPSAPSPSARPRQRATESQSADDADETDGDLADESRVRGQAERRAPPGPWQFTSPAAARNQQGRATTPVGNGKPMQQRAQDRSRSGTSAQSAQQPPPRYGKSFRFEHELSRLPSAGNGGRPAVARRLAPSHAGHFGTAEQLRQLRPGLQGYVVANGQRQQAAGPQLASQLKALAAGTQPRLGATRRQDMEDDDDDDDDDDDSIGGGGASGRRGRGSAAAPSRRQEARAAGEGADDNPDGDPELNPRESHLPAHSKPKKFEKSFAYVHRDLPKAGAKNPDDFVVSYGRGNLQTEHEDYDSDRDPNNSAPATSEDQDRAASVRRGANSRAPEVARRAQQAYQVAPRQRVLNGGQMRLPSHQRPGAALSAAHQRL